MKIVTVVGARPQFIKAAVVSEILRKKHTEVLIHTGQHYDYNMSAQFFKELDIPDPDYNLGISGGTHAQMTGRMMIAIEEILQKYIGGGVELLLVYGDTNSTLAAALSAAKLHIPICHVEAGVRTYNKKNPEEVNRILTDHLSSLLLASTQSGIRNINSEGLSERGYMVGDPMYDAFLKYRIKKYCKDFKLNSFFEGLISIPKEFYYLTCHREENTSDSHTLLEIFRAMEQLDAPTIYPVHPRSRQYAEKLQRKYKFQKIILCEPVGYLESIYLVDNAKKVVTDSGGLQREAFFAKKKCITILDFVCWPEIMVDGRNELSKPIADEIIDKLNTKQLIK